MAEKAVVLLSGGLDSAVTLALARARGFKCYALSFKYGQRHRHELGAAGKVAASLGVKEHRVLEIGLNLLGGSALTDDIDVPRNRPEGSIGSSIPVTYVPARNLIFLSVAVAWAEILPAKDIFIGVHAQDYSGYPDCREEFIRSFEKTANAGTREGVEGRPFRIHAPLIEMTKAGIIRKGTELGVDFSLTHSCYDPDERGKACGECDSCVLRRRGFRDAGVADPTLYQPKEEK